MRENSSFIIVGVIDGKDVSFSIDDNMNISIYQRDADRVREQVTIKGEVCGDLITMRISAGSRREDKRVFTTKDKL